MNTNASNDNLNATSEAEQQLDTHINERAKHPKMEELSKGMENIRCYYFISYCGSHSKKVYTYYEFHAVNALAHITHESLAFDTKDFAVMKMTLHKGSMYPSVRSITMQDLQDEAFIETNHIIGQISAS
jgi:hypothetical protein